MLHECVLCIFDFLLQEFSMLNRHKFSELQLILKFNVFLPGKEMEFYSFYDRCFENKQNKCVNCIILLS